MATLSIEVTSVHAGVINAAVLVNGRSAGTLQLEASLRGKVALSLLRQAGIEVSTPKVWQPALAAGSDSEKKKKSERA